MISALLALERTQKQQLQKTGAKPEEGNHSSSLRGTVALAVATGLSQGVSMLLLVLVLTAIVSGDWDTAMKDVVILIVAVIVHGVLLALATQCGFQSSMEFIRKMHRSLGCKLIRLPLSWFGPESQGRASHIAVRGTLFVATAAMDVLVPLIVSVISPLTLAVGAFMFDWRIGVALMMSAPFILLSSRLATRWESKGEEKVRHVRTDTDSRLLEFARSQQVLRASGMAEDYHPLSRAIDAQRSHGRSALWLSVGGMVLQGAVIQFVLALIIALVTWIILRGEIEPVTGVALMGLVVLSAGPLRILASLSTALEQSAQEINGVRTLLETPILPEPSQPIPFPDRHDIELDNVGFFYESSSKPVLDAVNLALPENSDTALVGPSGSGKTTVLRLVARLWDVTDGAVRIGGVDIRSIPTEELYKNVSMIFQDVYLFNDTLWENIKLGNPCAKDSEIIDAARRAHVLEIVERLPEGWNTRVGESGNLLSGGEKQRVSVARALLRNAPILLCDEPSSALDPSTRRAVTGALEDLATKSTVIVVAHQLETIRRAQIIVLLDRARIVAQGTHEQLQVAEQRYRDFWSLRNEAGYWNLARRHEQ